MKIFLLNKCSIIIQWFKNIFGKNKETKSSAFNFYSLAPTNEIENGQNYFEALSWALDNREDKNIKNIAFTGSYGSGKSSILQSYQKINSNKELHFLNISLATFKEEKEIEDKTEGENLQRLIELSILQQLFYRERDQKLPDSRLKKITSFSWIKLLLSALGSLIFILAITLLFKPSLLSSVLPNIEISEKTKIVVHYISLALSIIGSFYIALKSVRILHNLKIRKLNINNAEIEISDSINKSVLNHNLEEVLYFFEVTPYNVVIIEDLDRFQETEIFTKLREINLLINNSKKINKSVVFIYAIRDEMFSDKDRTKFFDFIIPVIPVINSSNSNEILQKEIKPIAENISDSLIDDISLFIDEMRVLYNIVNEFQIYKQLLSNKLNEDKLLSMIVYKNIYPYDFVKLSNYGGDLYDTINKKHEYIKQQSYEIEEKITELKKEIKRLSELKIKNIEEMRSLYLLQYIKQINSAYKVTYFYLNNEDYNFEQVLKDTVFPYLIENDTVYYGGPHQGRRSQRINFKDIEQQVDSEYNYKEREQQIKDWDNDKTKELKQKISELENQKSKLRGLKIGHLISNKKVPIETNNNKQKLINLLLRNGYIGEDYLDYISLFHEGSLSKNDHAFLLNVKSQISTDFNHNLDRVENLIKKIHIYDFKKEYILNYKMIDSILEKNEYSRQKEAVFDILKNETDISIRFIDGYIDNGNNPQLFLKELYHYQISVFDFMYRASVIPDERLAEYLKLIIENADINDIKEASKDSFLPVVISDNPNGNYDFFDLISDEEKAIETLKSFNIKLKYDFTTQNISENILNYIYENNHYIIRADLLKTLIQAKGDFNQVDFDTRNYYAIQNSNCIKLASYVDSNISEYINSVYLKLDNNTQEREDCLIMLLNNEDLSLKEKNSVVQKVDTKISTLSEMETQEIGDLLLENSRLQPNWEDIIARFVDGGNVISKSVITFFDNNENAEILSKRQIPKEPDETVTKNISESILLNELINNESYELLIKSIPYYYPNLDFKNMSNEKVKLLIENNKLGLSKENYNRLRESFVKLHTVLIEKRKHELLDNIDNLEFDDSNIIALLKSSVLSTKEKITIIAAYDNDAITANIEILGLISNLINTDNS